MGRRMKVTEPENTQDASGEQEQGQTEPSPEPAPTPRRVAKPLDPTVDRDPASEGEIVTVTFGEEIYTPQQFFSYRVGPYSGQTKVRPGETRVEAGRRLYRELAQLADDERKQRREDYLASVKDLFAHMDQLREKK